MTNETKKPRDVFKARMARKLFDVENALGMYAKGFCTIPAEAIYDKSALKPLMDSIRSSHIYLIGLVPRIDNKSFSLNNNVLQLVYTILGNDYTLKYDVPKDWTLTIRGDAEYLLDPAGNLHWPDDNSVQQRLRDETGVVVFDVKYIGQAYGQDGSRNALDRLLKHETLQKISLKGIPEGFRLTLLLLSIEQSTQLITQFNPFAANKDDDGERVKAGLNKLFDANEQERTTLYEASLIKYFSPEYNKEFKDSFPSTNLKVLQDCYNKDFSAVIAEISHDEIPFLLKSQRVAASQTHIARHDLHNAEDRRMFCGA